MARERERSCASMYSTTALAASLNSACVGSTSRFVGADRAYIGTSYRAPRSSNIDCRLLRRLAGLKPAALTASLQSSS